VVQRSADARQVTMVGSVKWREQAPFSRRDLTALAAQRAQVPGGGDAALVAVSRVGYAIEGGLDRSYGPADLVAAWR